MKKYRKNKRNKKTGFVALVAVILLATGTIVFSLATMANAVAYADSINRRELRVQTRLNAETCLNVAELKVTKNYFINGRISIDKLGCIIEFTNDYAGNITFDLRSTLSHVAILGKGAISIRDGKVTVDLEEIY